ncbi:Nucleotidyltransferase [Tilletiaria anomala UBC 951]|uniref:DNA polymerase n=1 Tax=Tilletiaria anomala (strain ATCC 24038 / CBS 436.72 / UBC 951) TaxID=1037660 RepID=A0A066VRP9_TILAU|nr:Nucleotidyltransferase [Tilletiaria anomala UBC 951]KDN44377.1 Nucleotidyltransferase [Tilletiaria anomala UBC 951]
MTHTNESIDDPPPWENSSSACRRPTPLKSKYNQDLVDMLDIVQRQRALLDDKTALPYARAVSIIKSYPEDLRQDPSKAKTLKGVGPKTFKMVRQYYELGKINEAEIIRRDYAFRVLSDFTQIYKIGPKKARELYAQGYRRIEELIVAKEWRPGKGGDIQVPEALRILPDLQVPISREEVEEIVRHIKAEMDEVIAGTEHTIVGGYRRGKTSNNDVDVIFTYPSGGPHGVPSPSQMQELRERLERKGLITHYISLSNMNGRGSKSDGLHTMEIVFKAPRSPIVPVSRHRRVDIIFCRYRVYGAAILGWTGSKQFERDLRVVAQQEGYKFNSDGLVEKDTSRTLDTFTERQIFHKLKLPYMPPEWRNCDP